MKVVLAPPSTNQILPCVPEGEDGNKLPTLFIRLTVQLKCYMSMPLKISTCKLNLIENLNKRRSFKLKLVLDKLDIPLAT